MIDMHIDLYGIKITMNIVHVMITLWPSARLRSSDPLDECMAA